MAIPTVTQGVLLVSFAFAALALTQGAWSHSAARKPTKEESKVVIPNTQREEFVSKVNGHRYAITVAIPFSEPPAQGYGVLYVLDGYWYFATAAELARMVCNATGVVVVGISYPDDVKFLQNVHAERGPMPRFLTSLPLSRSIPYLERQYDLTLPVSDVGLAAQTYPGIPKESSRNVGGLDDFLSMIETEVKPRVAAFTPINAANQALFGHSLGGLAALHALFVEPNAFRTFIIASPSIWWNNKAVLADEWKLVAAVKSRHAQPRVLVTVGSEEGTFVIAPGSSDADEAAAADYARKIRMIENVGDLVASLKALPGGPDYRVDRAVFDNEGHSASAWAALSRGIPFAFADNVAGP